MPPQDPFSLRIPDGKVDFTAPCPCGQEEVEWTMLRFNKFLGYDVVWEIPCTRAAKAA